MRRAIAHLRCAPRFSFSPFTGRRCREATDEGQGQCLAGSRRPSSGCGHLLPVNGEKHAGLGRRVLFLPIVGFLVAPALAGSLNLPTTRTDLPRADREALVKFMESL